MCKAYKCCNRNFLPINHGRNKVTSSYCINYRIKGFLKHIPQGLVLKRSQEKLKESPKEKQKCTTTEIYIVTHKKYPMQNYKMHTNLGRHFIQMLCINEGSVCVQSCTHVDRKICSTTSEKAISTESLSRLLDWNYL